MKRILIALALFWPALAVAQVSPYPLGVSAPIFGLPASAVNGGGGFSPSLLGPESCTVPAYSFITAPTNGWGGSGGTTACAVIGGTQRLGITSTAVTSTVPYVGPVGTSAATSFNFGTAGTGLYETGVGSIGWASTGVGLVGVLNGLGIGLLDGMSLFIGNAADVSISRAAAGLVNVASGSVGIQFNTGTAAPTVGTCGTGTITAGSRNTTGSFTATGATACTVTFGAPAWTNAPFCTITAYGAPTTVPYINGAPTTTAFVIAGLTAGDNLLVGYHCVGRI